MLKNLKRLFTSLFVLMFSSVWFLSVLQVSAAACFSEQIKLEERILSYTTVQDLGNLSRRDYSSICKNLYRLITSRDDYEEMYNILNNIAFCLFGRDLNSDLQLDSFDKANFISLYNKTVRHILPPENAFFEYDFNLFDAIFVYSYISILDDVTPVEKSLLEITLILNNIHPETLTFFRED